MVSRYASEQCFYVREMGVRTMTAFLLDTHRDNDVLVVVVSGEIDMATAPTLMAAASCGLAQLDVASLRLDMSQVSFLDSSGLGVLVSLHEDATARGKSMIVWKVQPGPRRTIELAGLQSLLVIEPAES